MNRSRLEINSDREIATTAKNINGLNKSGNVS